MTPKEKTLKTIMDNLDSSICGLFADRDTLEECQEYAVALLKSSSLDEREFAYYTSCGIYHNTLVKLLKKMIQDAFEETK